MRPSSGALKRGADEASALQSHLDFERQRNEKRARMQHILRPGMAPRFMAEDEEEETTTAPAAAPTATPAAQPSSHTAQRHELDLITAQVSAVAVDLSALEAPDDDAGAPLPSAAPAEAGEGKADVVEDRRAAIRRRAREREEAQARLEAEQAAAAEAAAAAAAAALKTAADVESDASSSGSSSDDDIDGSDPLLASLRTSGLGSRPLYVPRSARGTLAVRESIAAAAAAETAHASERAEARAAEALTRAAAAIEAEEGARAAEKARSEAAGPVANEPYPDDSEPAPGDVAREQRERDEWEARELRRVKREVLARVVAAIDAEEADKRRDLTDEDREIISKARKILARAAAAAASERTGAPSVEAAYFVHDDMTEEDRALFARDTRGSSRGGRDHSVDRHADRAGREAPAVARLHAAQVAAGRPVGVKGQIRRKTLAEEDTSAGGAWGVGGGYRHGGGSSRQRTDTFTVSARKQK